jgi:hypothetical protein
MATRPSDHGHIAYHATDIMKPVRSILDTSFHYVPSVSTSVAETWRRFGWRPTTASERDRQSPAAPAPVRDLAGARLGHRPG